MLHATQSQRISELPVPLAVLPAVKLLLTVEEAAAVLSLSRTRLYGLVMRKEIYSIKVGGARRIPMQSLHEFVQRLSQR
jgi:excisionase family DNA binding protein